jgi:DNA-binding XRE family transcriptional regulator
MQPPDSEPVAESNSHRSTRIAAAVRKSLAMTQAEFAGVLGVSVRAVQSYEQGWRVIPTATILHMFALLASIRRRDLGEVPCWVLKGCSDSARADCRSHCLNGGLFCWLVAGNVFGKGSEEPCGPLKCIDCAVIRRLLAPPAGACVQRILSRPDKPSR